MKITDLELKKNENNFDFVRLTASIFVVIGHSSNILYNKNFNLDLFEFFIGIKIHSLGVKLFFIISGFLVLKSWENKKSILDFFVARVLRIFPALVFVVLCTVFVLGVLFTTYQMSEYFNSQLTSKYLQNITLYRMYYQLPGVFESNPHKGSVNGSLWTLPYEFTCYLIVICIGILKITKNKWFTLITLVVCTVVYLIFKKEINQLVIPILGIDFKNFTILLLYFLAGSCFYLFRNKLNFNKLGIIICLIGILLIRIELISNIFLIFILPYLMLFFVFSKKLKLNHFGKYGDFSYGIYLFAFPIQQIIVYFLPNINILTMIFLSVFFTFPFAFFSWKFIEKPALKLRTKISKLISI